MFAIGSIISGISLSEVVDAVVQTVAIYMIKHSGPIAIHVEPSKMVCLVMTSVYYNLPALIVVAILLLNTASGLASGRWATLYFICEQSSFAIVVQQLM